MMTWPQGARGVGSEYQLYRACAPQNKGVTRVSGDSPTLPPWVEGQCRPRAATGTVAPQFFDAPRGCTAVGGVVATFWWCPRDGSQPVSVPTSEGWSQ